MKFYEVTIIFEDDQQERLESLARRFKGINGWGEKEILQFVVNGCADNTNAMLTFMEKKAEQLEEAYGLAY